MMFGMVLAVIAHGAVAEDTTLKWHTIGAGGGSGTGKEVELNCTIGQAIAGSGAGSSFMLAAGYWGGATRIAVRGDCDGDGDVQLDDFACFSRCFTGERGFASVECALFDFDSDGLVGANDYVVWNAHH
jgi:hypothetical protein